MNRSDRLLLISDYTASVITLVIMMRNVISSKAELLDIVTEKVRRQYLGQRVICKHLVS